VKQIRLLSKSLSTLFATLGIALPAYALQDLPLGPSSTTNALSQHKRLTSKAEGYRKRFVTYSVPKVPLVDSQGNPVSLAKLAHGDRPLVVNFIFATCPTICPILTGTFKGAKKELMASISPPLMISITIDPEHDTPEILEAYRKRHRAGSGWLFLTGSHDAILNVEKAMDIYRGDKMSHEAVTLIKVPQKKEWLRLDGFTGTTALVDEYRALLKAQ